MRGDNVKTIKLVILALIMLLLAGCVAKNAYDNINFEHMEEGIETYLNQGIIEYEKNTQYFSRDQLDNITYNGKKIVVGDNYMDRQWTHGIMNYPLLTLHGEDPFVIDIQSQSEVINNDLIKAQLKDSWDKLVGNKELNFGDIPVGYLDFSKISVAKYCPHNKRVALILESEYKVGTTYSTIGSFDLEEGKITFTNVSKGSFIPSEFGGDIGPFWRQDGCEFAYTLGDKGDYSRYLYVDCHKTGNIISLNSEILQYYLDLQEQSFYFPNFRDLKWVVEEKKLLFSTRAYDNSGEAVNWVVDVSTGLVEVLD